MYADAMMAECEEECFRTPVKMVANQQYNGGSTVCFLAVLNVFKSVSFPLQQIAVEK